MNAPHPLRLVPLTEEDLPLLKHLLDAGEDYFQALGEERVPPDLAEHMMLTRGEGGRHLMAIYRGDEPVGLLDFRLRYPDNAAAQLGLILLRPEWRGKGLGSLAMDIWETWLDLRTPIERVRAAVPAHLRRAQRFFLRREYHLTGEAYRVRVHRAQPRLLILEKLLGVEPPAQEP